MKKIVVPIDFGAAANAALINAREVALRYQGQLTLVHVLPVTQSGVIYGESISLPPNLMLRLESYQHDRAQRRLDELAARLGLASVSPTMRLPRGSTSEQVTREAEDMDLLVLGATEHLTRPGLAERLCRTSPCPLLACPPLEKDATANAFMRGIVAVDGSELSANVARAAAALLAEGGSLELVHVSDPSPIHHVGTDMSGAPTNPTAGAAEAASSVAHNFDEWIGELDLGVQCSGYIANEPPAEAVLERAVTTEADFVACGAHSKAEASLGLAEVLLRHAPIPILVVNG